MPFSDEQAKAIKEQIFNQLKNLPEDQREQIRKMISAMSNSELEEFLIKNKMMQEQEGEEREEDSKDKNSEETSKPGKNMKKEEQCIFCMISSKQLEAFSIYEDKDYLAALEIKPLTKGHTILIPKKHITNSKSLTSKAFTIANKLGRHISKKLGAENFQINSSDELKHAIINIIPAYKGEKPDYERKPAKKQDLQETAIKIGGLVKKEKITKIRTERAEKTEVKSHSEDKPKSHFPQFLRRVP